MSDASPPRRLIAVSAPLTAAALLVAGALLYRDRVQVAHGPRKDAHIVDVELGGSAGALRWVTSPGMLRSAVLADFVLIAGYGAALLIGTWLAVRVLRSSMRPVARFGQVAAVSTIVADCAENAFLLVATSHGGRFAGIAGYDAAAVAATVKFAAAVPAALLALTGATIALLRGLTVSPARTLDRGELLCPPPIAAGDPDDGAAASGPAAAARWRRGYHAPACGPGGPPGEEVVGIGLSGGGIRAASTALGVLQSPRFREQVVPRARYLVSVSGGGYTAGAFAQFLTGAGTDAALPPEELAERGRTAFLVGTPEEDHVRRHSSYLADTPALMAVALSVIAWHLLLTLLLAFGTAVVAGIGVGLFYRHVPLAVLDPSLWQGVSHGATPQLPGVRTGSYWAIGVTAALAAVVWLAGHFRLAHDAHPRTGLRRGWITARRALTALAGATATLSVGLPMLIWFAAWFLHQTRGAGFHTLTPLLAVGFTYLASVLSLLGRAKPLLGRTGRAGGAGGAAPRGFLQIVLVIAANLVLLLGWLILLGAMATIALHRMDTATVVLVWMLAAAVLFLGGVTDETTLSLHPFYRARLAATFAVRRWVRPSGHAVAVPYDRGERSTLSQYGRHDPATRFPHIIFAASATVGEHRAPPGQNRVSYTLCSHWVGGPDVGFVATDALERIAPPRLRRDLTVQGAVALSGAAIAASLGGQGSAWYESLFVLTGARLGAWMPNPRFFAEHCGERQPATVVAGLPRVRRLSYLLRELFGVHAADDPLLQVTDGGFYDNLGLIELFRRGCTRIYCVDASGDGPPLAGTLAQTLLTARRELGVETRLDDDTFSTYTAGSAAPLTPAAPLAALSQRLAERGIIEGSFSYPACGPSAGRDGRLIVAKASLWPALGYPLLAYAHSSGAFPHDSTADQFFDADQYTAYTELGRALGDAMVDSSRPPGRPPSAGSRPPARRAPNGARRAHPVRDLAAPARPISLSTSERGSDDD